MDITITRLCRCHINSARFMAIITIRNPSSYSNQRIPLYSKVCKMRLILILALTVALASTTLDVMAQTPDATATAEFLTPTPTPEPACLSYDFNGLDYSTVSYNASGNLFGSAYLVSDGSYIAMSDNQLATQAQILSGDTLYTGSNPSLSFDYLIEPGGSLILTVGYYTEYVYPSGFTQDSVEYADYNISLDDNIWYNGYIPLLSDRYISSVSFTLSAIPPYNPSAQVDNLVIDVPCQIAPQPTYTPQSTSTPSPTPTPSATPTVNPISCTNRTILVSSAVNYNASYNYQGISDGNYTWNNGNVMVPLTGAIATFNSSSFQGNAICGVSVWSDRNSGGASNLGIGNLWVDGVSRLQSKIFNAVCPSCSTENKYLLPSCYPVDNNVQLSFQGQTGGSVIYEVEFCTVDSIPATPGPTVTPSATAQPTATSTITPYPTISVSTLTPTPIGWQSPTPIATSTSQATPTPGGTDIAVDWTEYLNPESDATASIGYPTVPDAPGCSPGSLNCNVYAPVPGLDTSFEFEYSNSYCISLIPQIETVNFPGLIVCVDIYSFSLSLLGINIPIQAVVGLAMMLVIYGIIKS